MVGDEVVAAGVELDVDVLVEDAFDDAFAGHVAEPGNAAEFAGVGLAAVQDGKEAAVACADVAAHVLALVEDGVGDNFDAWLDVDGVAGIVAASMDDAGVDVLVVLHKFVAVVGNADASEVQLVDCSLDAPQDDDAFDEADAGVVHSVHWPPHLRWDSLLYAKLQFWGRGIALSLLSLTTLLG